MERKFIIIYFTVLGFALLWLPIQEHFEGHELAYKRHDNYIKMYNDTRKIYDDMLRQITHENRTINNENKRFKNDMLLFMEYNGVIKDFEKWPKYMARLVALELDKIKEEEFGE